MTRYFWPCILFSLFGCATPPEADVPRVVQMSAEPLLLTAVSAEVAAKVDQLELFRPMGVRWLGDTLLVSESGNHQIRAVGPGLNEVFRAGSEGSGPGEVRGPTQIQLLGPVVAVLDVGNLRINEYSIASGYSGSARLPATTRAFALIGGDRFLLPDEKGEHAFVMLDRSGRTKRLGKLPPQPAGLELAYPEGRLRMKGVAIDMVAILGDTVVVADNVTGVIGLYEMDGDFLTAYVLPIAMLQRRFDRFRSIDEGFGATNYFTAVYKDISVTNDGRLLAVLSIDDIVGILLDPATGRAWRLEAPPSIHGAGARTAFSGAMNGKHVAFAGMNGLHLYRIAD